MARFPNRGQGGDNDGPFGPGGGGMLPMGMFGGGMPIIIREGSPYQPQQQQQGHADTPPVRALLALKYLQWLKDTQDKRPMPESITSDGRQEFKIVDGQVPSPGEEDAGIAAASVLEHYFKGDLKPNVWEAGDLSPAPIAELNCACVPRDPATGRALGSPAENCMFCSGRGKMRVVFDAPGTGQLLVQASDPNRPKHPELEAAPPAAAPQRARKSPPQT